MFGVFVAYQIVPGYVNFVPANVGCYDWCEEVVGLFVHAARTENIG
jgi:hypothetical protein